MKRVLVVEDGLEYSETLGRVLGEQFVFTRAGSGVQALSLLEAAEFDVIFLDMRFDRAPESELLGDGEELTDRFNGDPVQARRFLEDHQGTFILAELRSRGYRAPVVISFDFTDEPARWKRLLQRYSPVDYIPDQASPADVARRLASLTKR